MKSSHALIISTGEDTPAGHSIRARILVLEMGPKDLRWDLLSQAQQLAAQGALAAAFSGYVQYLAANHDTALARHRERALQLRAEVQGAHRRTPSIIGDLLATAEEVAAFAQNVGALNQDEAYAFTRRCHTALLGVAEAQAAHQHDADPVLKFISLVSAALASGKAHVAGPDGNAPENQQAWGWRKRSMGDNYLDQGEWVPQGARIGWVEGTNLYLQPEATYRAAEVMAGERESLGLSSTTLWKRLDERHILASRDSTRRRLTIRKTLEGSRHEVLHLDASAVGKTSQQSQVFQSQHDRDIEFPFGALADGDVAAEVTT